MTNHDPGARYSGRLHKAAYYLPLDLASGFATDVRTFMSTCLRDRPLCLRQTVLFKVRSEAEQMIDNLNITVDHDLVDIGYNRL